jgi:hypothetical protein
MMFLKDKAKGPERPRERKSAGGGYGLGLGGLPRLASRILSRVSDA